MSTDAGFLNDLGLDQVEADPNYIPDGKYAAFVYESKLGTSKAGKRQWVITYKLEGTGQTIQEFKTLHFEGDPDKVKQQKSFLKQRVLSLGVPDTRVGQFNPSEVVGVAVTVQIKHKDGYQNVGNVELRNTGPSVSAGISAAPQTSTPSTGVAGLL